MKRTLKTLSEKWPEYLLEIIVLIIGIYGAFAVDNWNEDRKWKKETTKITKNLNDEFVKNEQELWRSLSYQKLQPFKIINHKANGHE